MSLRAKRGNLLTPPKLLRRPDSSGLLATTRGGIAEPVPKRKRGISAPRNDRKGVTQVLNEDTPLTPVDKAGKLTDLKET